MRTTLRSSLHSDGATQKRNAKEGVCEQTGGLLPPRESLCAILWMEVVKIMIVRFAGGEGRQGKAADTVNLIFRS